MTRQTSIAGSNGVVAPPDDVTHLAPGADGRLPPELTPFAALVARSRQPMALAWGESFVHNAAFASLCTGSAAGQVAALADVLGDSEPGVAAAVRSALDGQAQQLDDCHLAIDRNGVPADVWFSLSLTPIPCDGASAGLLLVASETTAQRIAERERRGAEVALAECQRRAGLLQAIFDTSPDVIFAKDEQGRMLIANPAALALIGRPGDEVIGRTDLEFLQDRTAAEMVTRNDRRIMESGVAEEIEEIVPGADGTPIVWHSRKMPWRSQSRTLGLLGISRDITERKRLEAELAASAQQLQRILGSITDGVAFLDRDWRYTYFSEQGARLLGVRPESVLGGCLWELFPHAAISRFGEEYRRAVATGEPTHFEAYYPEPLNAWIECHCYPSSDGLAVFFRNVTERHRTQAALHESESRLRRVFDANPIGMVVGDESGRLKHANPAFLRLVGYGEDDLARGALRWDAITPPEHLEADRRAIDEVARDGVSSIYEKEYLTRAGERLPVLLACARLSEENDDLVAFVIDNRERKRAERQLREDNENKSRFIAQLAHELRNPLAPIRSGVALLQQDPPPRIAQRTLQIMERQLGHVVRLTDDLLDMARLGSGKVRMRFQPADLRDVVESALDAAMPAIQENGHTLEVDLPASPCIAEIDPARMVQALGNLLGNACRYTPHGGRIRVSLAATSDGVARLAVCDDGVGIAPEHLARVFDLFFQEPQRVENRNGGLGIGLALVRELVAAHGGRVQAFSDGPGQGSTFAITMPLAPGAAAAAGEAASAAPSPAGATPALRILVVDDNVDAVETLSLLLTAMGGHEVRCLFDGAEVLGEARRFDPHLVLLDIGLPGRNGYELAAELGASWEGRPGATIAALTGWGGPGEQDAARRHGFDCHLTKPVDLDALQRLLADAAARMS